jgi:hypothetical protein
MQISICRQPVVRDRKTQRTGAIEGEETLPSQYFQTIMCRINNVPIFARIGFPSTVSFQTPFFYISISCGCSTSRPERVKTDVTIRRNQFNPFNQSLSRCWFFLQLISPPSIQINQMPANVQVISIIINKLSK